MKGRGGLDTSTVSHKKDINLIKREHNTAALHIIGSKKIN